MEVEDPLFVEEHGLPSGPWYSISTLVPGSGSETTTQNIRVLRAETEPPEPTEPPWIDMAFQLSAFGVRGSIRSLAVIDANSYAIGDRPPQTLMYHKPS